ncbi:hypothetical protein L1987_74620 [Smallanthus sonchifolius]|uniref:Uncharacterized protein n=1 Tax=Smallanthus sonchifolius TaxID=185202 RepID=A0ACB9A3V2_9ASTR|nr:hypothetical protein L1987_74620 [Smallanthus sonchifolius]
MFRYESDNFYTEAEIGRGVLVCSNATSPQPIEVQKATEWLLLDLQIAAPRTTNFYAASARKVAIGNETVYAIAQCNLNVSQIVCLDCLKSRSQSLYGCLPATSGRSIANGCFMRYDKTPFFGQNETTDITSLLWDGDSRKMRYIIGLVVGGVSFLLLVLAFFLWSGTWKKIGRGQQDAPAELKGTVYNYVHLQLATNKFSVENVIGKGGFGEAILDDKKVVAVKKLKVGNAGAKVGFENEILLISHIRHRNLLRLLGWSSEGPFLLLVLEYMPNGSLDKFLWDKVDTFSFGIVILEIISGRKCTYRNFDELSNNCLLEHAWKLYENKEHLKLVDETMDVNHDEEKHVIKIIEIALLCTQSTVSKRPTMSEVVLMLPNDPSLGEIQITRPNFIDHDWRIQLGT